jgi:hypothetical protein
MAAANEENFFHEFYKFDFVKSVYLICNIILTLICPAFLYGIVWYEKNSSNLRYRTLINQLLSHLCFLLLLGCILANPLSIFSIIFGPFGSESCNVMLLVGRYLFACAIVELTLRQVIKYFYIFQWKYIVRINDDFAAFVITTSNIILSALFTFATYFLGFHFSEMDYNICT